MGTAVRFMPLRGVFSEDPLCYLLQVDRFSILLDCGWDDSFDLSLLESVKSHISDIDAVLLSHPDTSHLGALPYLMGKLGLAAPIYATLPVAKLGHLYMYDHVLSRQAVSDFDTFDLDDVDFAFNSVETLKYSENRVLSGKGSGITITPHAAGHLVGGTLWKISKDGEEIIYAVDYNHRKERHLNGTVFQNFVRPAVLITDAYNALSVQAPPKQRDQDFLEFVQGSLRAGGSVLIPVDTAGRVLEVILCLEHYWQSNRAYQEYPIALLTSVSYNVVDFAKSSLEWMADNIGKHFERARANAFDLRHTTLCHSLEDLAALPPGPRVVLASMGSLETGFSRLLLEDWTKHPSNLILFPERGQPGTLARTLQQAPTPARITLTLSQKIPLEGEELEKHREEQAAQQRQRLEEERKALQQLGAVKVEEEARKAELEAMQDAGPSGASLQVAAEPGGGPLPAVLPESVKREVFIDGFELPPGAAHPMFPDEDDPKPWDEYGEVIDPEEFRQKEDDPMDLGRNLADPQSGTSAAPEPESILEDDAMLIDDRPSKVVTRDVELEVRCKVRCVDMEGRPDGRSMKNIMEHVAPIKTILVHGTREATENLRRFCETKSGASVHTPDLNQWVDVSSAVGAYKVKLTEEIMSGVVFRKMGDYEVAWVDSEVGVPEKHEQTTEYGVVEKSQMLPLLPIQGGSAPGHKAVYVGEVKLSDFRAVLVSHGIIARFADGALHCGKHVIVRKDAGPSGASLQVAAEPGGCPLPAVLPEFVKREVIIDGFELPPGAAYPMFPDEDDPRPWDEYGEVIDAEEFRQKEDDPMDLGRNLADPQSRTSAVLEPESILEDDAMVIDDRPSKVVTRDVELEIRCKVRYVDMEGRPDGRSMKNIIEHVAPIKTILVHGTREATDNLRRFCEAKSGASVHTPDLNQCVDVSSAVGAYKVKLTEEIMSGVVFRKMGDYEVAWVDSEVGVPEKHEQTTEYGVVEKSQMLPLLPIQGGSAPGHKAVYVGEVKLSDFRAVLVSQGIPARFADGALHCGKHVIVRKVAQQQQLVIEGPLSEEYYKVRELLYSQFYIV